MPFIHTIFLTAIAIVFYAAPDIQASKITDLDIPLVVRNGTGPIDLSCIYNVEATENGLVIKWYHESDQIYQWIPPMPPQVVGIIQDLVEYPERNLHHPYLRSIIRLKVATIEMGGMYTCAISTFQEEDSKEARMIVYVPEKKATLHASPLNGTHLNLTCIVEGAQPRPILRFYVVGMKINGSFDGSSQMDTYDENAVVTRHVIVKHALEPMLLDCEISIPDTDYKRRERIVYYPTRSLSQNNRAIGRYQASSCNILNALIFVCELLWVSNKNM